MFSRENTISLIDFVKKYNGKEAETQQLVNAFLEGYVPAERFFPRATKYVAKEYLDKKDEAGPKAAFELLLQKAFVKVFPGEFIAQLRSRGVMSEMEEMWRQLYGVDVIDEETSKQIYLFGRAAFFQFTKTGACSYRASYAALNLFDILRDSSSVVAVQSAPSADQFVVLLGNKKDGFYIYDPLTNPSIVFDRQFYLDNILTQFPASDRIRKMFQLRITEEIFVAYNKRYPFIHDKFIALIEESEKNIAAILKDSAVLHSLLLNKIPMTQMRSVIKLALNEIKVLSSSAEKKVPTL